MVGVDLQDYNFRHTNFKFLKGNFLNNDFKDQEFDVVVAVSTIEHCGLGSYGSPIFSNGDKKVINEIARIVKKGGIFIITIPYGQRYKVGFVRVYDGPSLRSLLSGFKIITEKYFIRNESMTEWQPSPKEKAERIKYFKDRGVDSVTCLVCMKK